MSSTPTSSPSPAKAERRGAPAGPSGDGFRPWTVPAAEVARRVGVEVADGLSPEAAATRLAEHGANVIVQGKRRGPVRIFLAQLTDVMILILVAAAVVSGILGELLDAGAIVAIVVLNAIVGFVQEYRAEKAMEALQAMAAPVARVRRGSRAVTIDARAVVPGDVVLLEAGAVVPADLRLTEVARLRTQEAALTGESAPVDKTTSPVADPDAGVGDRLGMAFKGTLVTYGRGEGVVVGTGMATELGRIARLLQAEAPGMTPLQRRLAGFGRRLALGILVLCAVLFGIGVLRGEQPLMMFLVAVSLAVAAIPEALPAVVTVALALGARRMAARHALVRRLAAVESLGSVTFICADKTGTLTQNRMEVDDVWPASEDLRDDLHRAMCLNNDARSDADGSVHGDPTEAALLLAAAEVGLWRGDVETRLPRVGELPFDSERKRMTTFHQDGDAVIAYTKGAPEAVLDRCRDGVGRHEAADAAAAMAARGLRVLAFARRWWAAMPVRVDGAGHAGPAAGGAPAAGADADEVETGLTLLGLVGLIDPPRPEARHAVDECRDAGIVPVMITGDHPATARAVAGSLGILAEGGEVLTGAELRALPVEALAARVDRVRVYARVDPEQKIDIVKALQARGQFVAMTGDGVNDAPALRRADVGVAMGLGGTDVAREAAALILLDDDFATIVAAVEEGRRIFDNIRKFVRFVLGGNLGEILTVFLAPLLGLPMALLPIQILWVNLLTDGLPGLALTVEGAEPGVMRRPPLKPGAGIFDLGVARHVVGAGTLIGALTLGTFWITTALGLPEARTLTFTVLTFAQMAHVTAVRATTESTFRLGLLSNRFMVVAVGLTVALQLAVVYLPPLQVVMKTRALTLAELGIAAGLASVVFVAVELEKAVLRLLRRRRAG